jgi:hypothetical protein
MHTDTRQRLQGQMVLDYRAIRVTQARAWQAGSAAPGRAHHWAVKPHSTYLLTGGFCKGPVPGVVLLC